MIGSRVVARIAPEEVTHCLACSKASQVVAQPSVRRGSYLMTQPDGERSREIRNFLETRRKWLKPGPQQPEWTGPALDCPTRFPGNGEPKVGGSCESPPSRSSYSNFLCVNPLLQATVRPQPEPSRLPGSTAISAPPGASARRFRHRPTPRSSRRGHTPG